MSLNISVLKVSHSSRSEARKLIPHIKDCDVFSPENAGCSERKAKLLEKTWQDTLQLPWYKFWKTARRIKNCAADNEYMHELFICLYQEKRPIISLERWSEQKEFMTPKFIESYNRRLDVIMRQLIEGKIEDVIELTKDHIMEIVSMSNERDSHIAANLKHAEQLIRTEIPFLSNKQPIKLTIMLGCMHRLEDYANVNVVWKVNKNDHMFELENRLSSDARKKNPMSRRDILAYFLSHITTNEQTLINEQDLANASFEELVDVCKKLVRTEMV